MGHDSAGRRGHQVGITSLSEGLYNLVRKTVGSIISDGLAWKPDGCKGEL